MKKLVTTISTMLIIILLGSGNIVAQETLTFISNNNTFYENGIEWTIPTPSGIAIGGGNGGSGNAAEFLNGTGTISWDRDIDIIEFYLATEFMLENSLTLTIIFFDKDNLIVATYQPVMYSEHPIYVNQNAFIIMLSNGGGQVIPGVRKIEFVTEGSNNAFLDDLTYENVNPAFATTWTGTTDTDWHTATNWEHNVVPNRSDDVTIPTSPSGGNFPIIATGTDAECKNLDVETGASITINGNLDTTLPGN